MPRDGAFILSDLREPTLSIVCEACGRRGRYRVDWLMAEHGDAKLTDLLVTLADCQRARSAGYYVENTSSRCNTLSKTGIRPILIYLLTLVRFCFGKLSCLFCKMFCRMRGLVVISANRGT